MASQNKNLVVFSDGTGNRGGVTKDTNVWRLYQMVSSVKEDQLTYYDDGVGTNSVGLVKLAGGALGFGLGRNIKQIYTFLVKNYEAGDKIYLFGFSRGAYTVRCVLGMLNTRGLVKKCDEESEKGQCLQLKMEASLKNEIDSNFKCYRSNNSAEQTKGRDKNHKVTTEFIGVWDTVDAVGMPIDELKSIEALIWQWRGMRSYTFDDRTLRGVKHARQALAIDDERRTFHPNYWLGHEEGVDLDQVWFAGMHSNVGGSYPKDGLAYVTLEWMIAEIDKLGLGLKLHEKHVEDISHRANAHDKKYDSRSGMGVFYRYSPRYLKLIRTGAQSFWMRVFSKTARFQNNPLMKQVGFEGPPLKIHQSVWRRIVHATGDYAPLFLHDDTVAIAHTLKDNSPYNETSFVKDFPLLTNNKMPVIGAGATDKIKQLVTLRQIVYFVLLTLAISFAIYITFVVDTPAQCKDSTIEKIFKWLAPGFVHPAIDKLASNYWLSITVATAFTCIYGMSIFLRTAIARASRFAWEKVVRAHVQKNDSKGNEEKPQS